MDLRNALQTHFNFDHFRPGQEEVIQALLDGKSALALFPTGAGKSLCYQLPALLREGTALIISPLIALMKDQVDALRKRGIRAARLDSSLTAQETQQVYAELYEGTLKLLYVAPERLSSESFVARLRRLKIALFAIDEAHCISEWGHNFRPEYLRLARVAKELGLRPVLTLTATATPDVARDIREAFQIEQAQHIQTSFHRPNLHLRITPVTAKERIVRLTERLQSAKIRPAVVYVTLQKTAEDVAEHLERSGLRARAYHAGMADEDRHAAQEAFMRGTMDVIVATIAFGMGIDKADIRGVFHFNLPKTIENYQQEIGRAGRDGAPALCELFACADDVIPLENFTLGDTPTEPAVRALVEKLLGQGEEFDISRYDLSQRTDIRPLVVETVITYLELEGLLRPTHAFYESYQIQLLRPESEIVAGLNADRQQFLRRLFAAGKRGPKYITLKIEEAALALGEPRDRLMKALTWLEETGAAALKPSGLRHAYRLCPDAAQREPSDVTSRLHALFARREERELQRMEQILGFARHPGCLTRRLLAHFGEELPENCGHCHHCRTGFPDAPLELPKSPGAKFGSDDASVIRELIAEGHAALALPRQLTRFLCGLTSPATSRAKLTKHPHFGRLATMPFREVFARVEELMG